MDCKEIAATLERLLPGITVSVTNDCRHVVLRIANCNIIAGPDGAFVIPDCTLIVFKTEEMATLK